MTNRLYVVATPIGHLSDLSPRAAETLRTVDVVAAEDTRVTRVLLRHVGSAVFAVPPGVRAGGHCVAGHKHAGPLRVERLLVEACAGGGVAPAHLCVPTTHKRHRF